MNSDKLDNQTACEILDRKLKHLESITRNVFTCFSQAENLHPETMDLKAFMMDFEELAQCELGERSIELRLQAEEVAISADRRQLQLLLKNLLMNAAQALESYREDARIEIAAHAQGKSVVISVCDNGPGIPDQIRNVVFEPFVSYGRGERSGLGLSCVRAIVAAHNADIRLVTGDQGSLFTIQFYKHAACSARAK